MKIVLISAYNGYVERGLEVWAEELLTRLSKNNKCTLIQGGVIKKTSNYHTVRVPFKFDFTKPFVKKGIKRFIFIDYWSIKVALFTLASIIHVVKLKPDIVIPVNGGWQSAIIKIITVILGCRMVIVGQSGIGWDDINNLYSFPDVFVALSQRAHRWAKRKNPFVNCKVIPNAIDPAKFHGIETGDLELGLRKPVVLVVSALEEGKRVNLTVQAVSKSEDLSLLVIGNGEKYEDIRAMGQELLGDRFKLIKSIRHQDIPKYYKSADVFTLPSWENEAFGIVYLEAMACGLAIVATDDELRKEIIGSAGILIDPTDIDAYNKALVRAVLDIKLKAMALERVKLYSWQKISKTYEDLFNEIINK